MTAGQPWNNCYFVLELDGVEVGHFMEFSGLKTSTEVFEIQEGGLNGRVHKLPGKNKWENITLRNATSASTTLFEWRDRYLLDGFSERANTSGSIVIKDNDHTELRRYSFTTIWPVSWEGPGMNSGASQLAIETLEVSFEGFSLGGDAIEPTPAPPALDPPDIIVTDDEIKTPPVQFEYDSATLTKDGKKVCKDVAETLANHPEIEEVWIEGHTCTMGSWSYNKGLSQSRANAVKTEIQTELSKKKPPPDPPKRLHAAGYSYKYPVASNATEDGRIQNRRTEFKTTPPKDRDVNDTKPDSKPS